MAFIFYIYIKIFDKMDIEVEDEILLEEEIDLEKNLTIFNDDVNTFEHVIECLMRILKHTIEQAEQCAWIVHLKGRCVVKNGSFEKLKPFQEALLDEKIDARII